MRLVTNVMLLSDCWISFIMKKFSAFTLMFCIDFANNITHWYCKQTNTCPRNNFNTSYYFPKSVFLIKKSNLHDIFQNHNFSPNFPSIVKFRIFVQGLKMYFIYLYTKTIFIIKSVSIKVFRTVKYPFRDIYNNVGKMSF